ARARPRPDRSARIAREVALGIAHAHMGALAHGTLAARDVFLDEVGRAQVLGLMRPGQPGARAVEPTTAPEQLRPGKDAADAVADIYSIGALLWHMVAL